MMIKYEIDILYQVKSVFNCIHVLDKEFFKFFKVLSSFFLYQNIVKSIIIRLNGAGIVITLF